MSKKTIPVESGYMFECNGSHRDIMNDNIEYYKHQIFSFDMNELTDKVSNWIIKEYTIHDLINENKCIMIPYPYSGYHISEVEYIIVKGQTIVLDETIITETKYNEQLEKIMNSNHSIRNLITRIKRELLNNKDMTINEHEQLKERLKKLK